MKGDPAMATAKQPHELTPAECLRRLPEPTLDIDGDNPLDDPQRINLRRSILPIAKLNHVSEITLVQSVVAAVRDLGADQ
jgi:hypothetical protein